MKLKQVIDLVDGIEPNAYTNEVKTAWLNEVEGMVQTDVMLRAIEDIDQYTWTDDQQTVLLVRPPHDKLYRFYLQAMIQFANGEYDRYSNTMTVFNGAYGEFVRWFSRTVYPAGREAVWRGYYITAYGLAVQHGYHGTVEEWLASLHGVSPVVAVSAIPGGHRVTVTDAGGTQYFDVMDGEGSGDMMSAVYDPVGGVRQVAFSDEIPTTASEVDAIPTSEKGAANGVASLNSSGKVPDGQLPLPWTSTKTYAAGDYCEHNGYLWHNTSGAASTGVEPGTNYNVWNVTYSNPNLLDNWYFGNPVNQRGAGTTENPWTSGYGVDRWKIYNTVGQVLSVDGNGLHIDNTAGTAVANHVQLIDGRKFEVGDTITLSVLLQDGSIKSQKGVITEAGPVVAVYISGVASFYYAKSSNWVVVSVYAGQSLSIRAVKLELGSVSTLANDAPPNYAEELAKCQKYYNCLGKTSAYNAVTPFSVNGGGTTFTMLLPFQMRDGATTVKVKGTLYLKGSTGSLGTISFSGTESWTVGQNKPFLICWTNKALTGGIGGVALADGLELSVSADL